MWRKLLHSLWKKKEQNIHEIHPRGLSRGVRFYVESSVEKYRIVEFGGEREHLERFLQELNSTDIVWDIGANIGLYGISAAVQLTEGLVVSFEPDPNIASRLRQNIALNRLTNMQVVERAVAESAGDVTLFTDGLHGYSPTLQKQTRPGATQGEIRVQANSIDCLVESEQIPRASVVKIDIEGAEYLALKGMRKTLANPDGPRLVFLELHPQFLKSFGATEDECESIILETGFRIEYRVARENESLLICRRKTSEDLHAAP